MGDHEQGALVLLLQIVKKGEDFIAGGRVKIARRLIAEQQRGTKNESPRNGHALPLASREFVGPMGDSAVEADMAKHGFRCAFRLFFRESLQAQRQGHVLQRREGGQKIEGLKDHADFFAAQAGARVVGESRKFNAIHFY